MSQSQSQRSDFRNAGFFVFPKDMTLQNEINKTIQDRMNALKMNKAELAALMGVSAQYVGQLFKNNRRWNTDLQEKAFSKLNIKVIYKITARQKKEAV